MRVLIINDYLPYPLFGGPEIRLYNLIRRISKEHEISLVARLASPDQAQYVSHIKNFCSRIELVNIQRHHPLVHLPGLFRFALTGKPLELKFLYSRHLADKIRRLVDEIDFDIVHIERERMAFYVEALPPNVQCKKVLVFHNITSQQYARIFHVERQFVQKMRAFLYSVQTERWEPKYAERFDRIVATSEADRKLLISANSKLRVDVITNGVDTQAYQPLPQEATGPTLLYVGSMNYEPSVDAMLYFCREILPRIRRMLSSVELWIVGKEPAKELMQLNGNGVHITGQVQDVRPFYERSSISVVPLRAGGGTRGKILEAMALGRPVVSTTIGAEGLDLVDGQHLLIADTPKQFAEKVVLLLKNRDLYKHIVTEARELVVSKYDWDVVANKLLDIYSEMVNE